MSRANSPFDPPTAASTNDLRALQDRRDSPHDVPECAYCGHYRNPNTDVRGSFDTYECYLRQKGENALNRVEADHTFCATCFRRIKEIEKPPDDTHECVVGFQYPTPHMELAVDDFSDDPYRPLERTRWGCECGNVDPGERDDILDAVDLQTTITSLLHCLQALAAKDTLARSPSWPRMREAIRDHGRDWEYVVGAALYD
jgi:hypothetical protein